jgi:putative ABC transport system ATP-binding protein
MLRLTKVSKVYRTAEVETLALNEISMEVRDGEFVAVMGPSGCGKSTLLNTLGLLDTPTSGSFEFFGQEVARRSESELTALRC